MTKKKAQDIEDKNTEINSCFEKLRISIKNEEFKEKENILKTTQL